jgi:putative aminopeptidase FrvX
MMTKEKRSVELLEIVKALSEAPGVAGFEGPVQELIRSYWKPYVHEFRTDALGNLIGLRRGQRPADAPARSIMLATHCDEIGLMVTGIEEGFLRFTSVGGIDARVLPGQEVTVFGRQELPGVIGLRPPHLVPAGDRNKPLPMEELFVDVGLSQEQAQKLVSIGDPIAFRVPALELENERVAGKAFDNRASVAVATVCLMTLQGMHHAWDVYAVATTQEEVGLRGAMVSAYGIAPDIAIAIDVTFGDGPGLSDAETFELGAGPVIAIGPNVHPALHEALVEAAKSLEIPYQIEPMPEHSGTDGWAIQVTWEGIPTAVLSIPTQNMHSPVEVISLKDIRRAGRLLAGFISTLNEEFVRRLTFSLPE